MVPVSCIEHHNPDKEIEIEGEYLVKFRGNIYSIKFQFKNLILIYFKRYR